MVKESPGRLGESGYWAVVADCLVAFHGYGPKSADAIIAGYRARLEGLPPSTYALVFHEEPFYLAGELAEKPLELDEHYTAAYAEILARYQRARRGT
jgi:hypothetical protein